MYKRLMCMLLAAVLIFPCLTACSSTEEMDETLVVIEPGMDETLFVTESGMEETVADSEITLEEFLDAIEIKPTREFYERLYAMYDFEAFNARTHIPQYFQTVYYQKFSVGTIQSAGCGITSLAMISSYLFDEEITPDMMLVYDKGFTPASALEAGILDMKLNCHKYFGMAAAEHLDEALDAGHPIIANVRKDSIFTDSGHFIVIAGRTEDGKYIVNDPNLENYYLPRRVDGFMNGFTRKEIVTGLAAIYIFDTKEDFVDMRGTEDQSL